MDQYNGQVNFTYKSEEERIALAAVLKAHGYKDVNTEEDYLSTRASALCADRETQTFYLLAPMTCACIAQSGRGFHHIDDADAALTECEQEWNIRHAGKKKRPKPAKQSEGSPDGMHQ